MQVRDKVLEARSDGLADHEIDLSDITLDPDGWVKPCPAFQTLALACVASLLLAMGGV